MDTRDKAENVPVLLFLIYQKVKVESGCHKTGIAATTFGKNYSPLRRRARGDLTG
jgi:hypothetical protein